MVKTTSQLNTSTITDAKLYICELMTD